MQMAFNNSDGQSGCYEWMMEKRKRQFERTAFDALGANYKTHPPQAWTWPEEVLIRASLLM